MRMTEKTDIEPLFKAHYAPMHRLAMALLHDDELARDIVHDVFASLFESPLNFRVNAGYLLKAVRNRCLNHIRNCEIHRRVAALYFLDNEEYETEEWPDEETMSLIHTLIGSEVSPRAKEVIELRFERGMRFSEIAAEMGISETAVYRHLSHALAAIRKKLTENG